MGSDHHHRLPTTTSSGRENILAGGGSFFFENFEGIGSGFDRKFSGHPIPPRALPTKLHQHSFPPRSIWEIKHQVYRTAFGTRGNTGRVEDESMKDPDRKEYTSKLIPGRGAGDAWWCSGRQWMIIVLMVVMIEGRQRNGQW